MKDAKDLIPWKVTDISIRPYDAMWSMNPSIHFDGSSWRCVLRCTDYAMPNGHTIRSPKARPAGNQTKNAMVILDPQTWKPIQIHKMRERDDHPRVPCANVGYEDMRIFKTDRGGLQGIAASLHLERDGSGRTEGSQQHQPPEQVLLSFDGEYNIVAARPIRGDWWSGTPQKNWVPFDHCEEPRFLYSIDRGMMFDDRGAVNGDAASARPSPTRMTTSRSMPVQSEQDRERELEQEREREQAQAHEREQQERAREQERKRDRDRRPHHEARSRLPNVRGTDIQMVRGSRIAANATATRSSSTRGAGRRSEDHSRQTVASGRALPVKYGGLRGGSQLVHVGDGAWLGIGHEMQFLKSLKYYWHNFYLVDSRGRMTAASPSIKLASNGIEFAAGMAIDGDRVVVSFGTDDMNCHVGETSLSAVLGILRPVKS
jgi:hypothetical protein